MVSSNSNWCFRGRYDWNNIECKTFHKCLLLKKKSVHKYFTQCCADNVIVANDFFYTYVECEYGRCQYSVHHNVLIYFDLQCCNNYRMRKMLASVEAIKIILMDGNNLWAWQPNRIYQGLESMQCMHRYKGIWRDMHAHR